MITRRIKEAEGERSRDPRLGFKKLDKLKPQVSNRDFSGGDHRGMKGKAENHKTKS